jgi:SAM-dependent methyltransferase
MSVERAFQTVVEQQLEASGTRHAEYHREYARNRYSEGAKALAYLTERYSASFPRGARILDVGGGNGGFLLPFAERTEFACSWVDHYLPVELSEIVRATKLRLLRMLGDAARLPVATGSVDVVLYVETIEHVDAGAVGAEISRVLKPGGLCYITTPPRFRYLLREDPHYGLRGLLLLPDALQAAVFRRLRRNEPYEVEHLYWSVYGIMRTLPDLQVQEISSKNWAGVLRRFDWDWIVARKSSQRYAVA